MKPVIFLDIDGVLTTHIEFYRNPQKFQEKNNWAKELRVPYPFNEKCVKAFNKILTSIEVDIVLSSDWKKHWTIEELDIIFKNNGVIQSPVDKTPNTPISMSWIEKNRMSDIESYLRQNDLIDSNWIIIDDLNVREFLPEEYRDRVFLTRDLEGIKQSGLKEKIIKRLKKI